ncbi:MAG TPA: helix-turn-helix domain-containing protein [Acidimicrobiales bacterium]|nr:helix-turn-helix domain-containing protein [Acidimicrobiales bacterium]
MSGPPADHTDHRASRDDELQAIGALQEPVRRSLYRYVTAQRRDVSRDEAAEGVGIQRALAAFHLDKLVEAGLLEATFRRLTGRTGPGAGRPAKLYRRSSADHAVSLPPRTYDLAAELLAQAVEEDDGKRRVRDRVDEAGRRFGRALGQQAADRLDGRSSRERRLAALTEVLGRYGYEPHREGRTVRLGNCPFHALSETHRDLVCGMNLALLEGVVEGMEGSDLEACPDPRPGECCVAVVPKAKKT